MSPAARRPAPAGGDDPATLVIQGPLRPYWLVYGEEGWLVDRTLAALRRRLADDGGASPSWRSVWADDDSARVMEALADVTSPSLFGGNSVVVLRRADQLPAALEATVLDALGALGSAGRLVLVARTADQRRRLMSTCLKAGVGVPCPVVTEPRAAATWVGRMAREAGYEIDRAAVELLVDRVGTDLGCLASEIDKVTAGLRPREAIGVDRVRAIVAATRTQVIYALTDAIGRGDVGAAVAAYRGLVEDGEPPVKIVAFVAANVRRAMIIAELTEAGMDDAAIASRLGMPGWLVAKQRTRRTSRDLRHGLDVLAGLDLALKSSRPQHVVFEAAIADLVG